MDTARVAGLFCILGLVQWMLKSIIRNADRKFPRGPRPLGFVGNIFTLRRILFYPDQELKSIARKWGDTCLLWAARHPILIVNKPQIVKELLVDRSTIYSSRPAPNNFRSSIWPWRIILITGGERFRYLRKLYNNLLSPQRSVEARKYQDFESLLLLSDLLNQPEAFFGHIERFSMSVMFSAVYGIRLGKLDHPIMVEFNELWSLILQHLQPGSLLVDYFTILQKLPTHLQPGYKYAMRLRKRETRLHYAFYRTLQNAIQLGRAPECFGIHLFDVQKKDSIDDAAVVDILAMIIGAGGHSIGAILQSFFKIMALHPKVVQKAHLELDEVVGLDRLPSWEDQASLPYVRSLIKELHRCCGIVSLGVPHATTEDDDYRGQFIPKGASVIPNISALNGDPELYTNPDEFDPDRYQDHHLDAAASAVQIDYLQRDHFNYGFGRRLCPGISMAEQSLFIVISRLLWAFDIREKPGHTLNMSAKTVSFVRKHNPFQVDINSRGSAYSKVINEARDQSQSRMQFQTLDINDVIVRDI